MEIKRIGGVISTYNSNTAKVQAAKSAGAAASAKNTDRVEFGFESALNAAKADIAAEVRADASPRDLLDAKNAAEQGVESSAVAAAMFIGFMG